METETFFTKKNIETLITGAISGLTFGIYGSIITQRKIEEFNKKMDFERKERLEKLMTKIPKND